MGLKIKFSIFNRFVPFLQWLPELKNPLTLRADLLAGITVALVLIPQSMAYAQLAGLPPYYGLYAAFLPPMVAAIFGSSRQLATGPVAVVSLMTAAALEPIATAGSEAFLAYAVLLALMVGIFQLSLGLLRLGVLVNFLSHPVVVGFTNAAAIIIATSQLGKIFGVSVEKMPHHYETVWNTILAAIENTHLPTVSIAILAFAIMIILRRISPKLPGVLLAVVITTLIAWVTDFQKLSDITREQIASKQVSNSLDEYKNSQLVLSTLNDQIHNLENELADSIEEYGPNHQHTVDSKHIIENLNLQKQQKTNDAKNRYKRIKSLKLVLVKENESDAGKYFLDYEIPQGKTIADSTKWTIADFTDDTKITLHTGGNVVGQIPGGLPSFSVPALDVNVILNLVSVAIAISLIGFMEAISIAKAMAAKTRQRLDANQELIGQGLSNICGSLFQSYPVSGSFSRSAVNIDAGAITGFSSVVTSIVVIITLLWLTPLLYNLPQATLAAVIMVAVIGLVNIKAIKHAWQANKHDGSISVITFVLTLVFAPHLDKGIMIGVGLSLIMFLYRTMQPRVVFLARHTDGTLRDAKAFNLKCCDDIAMLRFEGSLYFANTGYFDNSVQKVISRKPNIKYLIIDGVSMNQMDATGEEMIRELYQRMDDSGIKVLFTRIKKPILDMLDSTGFLKTIGENKVFRRADSALQHAWDNLDEDHMETCPLHVSIPQEDTQQAV